MDKVKMITAEQAVRLAKKFKVKLDIEQVRGLENGSILFKKENIETKDIIYYRLQKFYFKPFKKKYSCNIKVKSGRELIISNMPLPGGSVII